MEDERVSSTMTKTEATDSTSSNSTSQRPSTSAKPNHKQNGGGSSRFKGVVYQQNGHWGAQIYANHRRIWLGTFKTEAAAATAYDSATIKLRQGDSGEAAHRNFPLTNRTIHEPKFQAPYTTDQVLNMIKDGSYETKFEEYLSSISQPSNDPNGNHSKNQNMQDGKFCQELFRKELTPSDVGKLNRLVIPKRHALKYFPSEDNDGRRFGGSEDGEDNGEEGGDMELMFYDNKMKSWKFRYCYWKSSQSFVFTRGWNKFVREKNLEANDIVAFYLCELRGDNNEGLNTYMMIDIVKRNDRNQSSNNDSDELEEENETQKGKALLEQGETSGKKKKKGIRLFGVQLVPANSDNDESSDKAR